MVGSEGKGSGGVRHKTVVVVESPYKLATKI